MKIHEYQAKEILHRFSVPIPKGIACFSIDEAEAAAKQIVDPAIGMAAFQARNLAYGLGLSGASAKAGAELFLALYRVFVETDGSLLEVNPLVVLKSGAVLPLDCKMTFDDNALYRHKELEAYRDLDEEEPSETEAKRYDLSFIKLDGSIGCMVNGAGLAMATM